MILTHPHHMLSADAIPPSPVHHRDDLYIYARHYVRTQYVTQDHTLVLKKKVSSTVKAEYITRSMSIDELTTIVAKDVLAS